MVAGKVEANEAGRSVRTTGDPYKALVEGAISYGERNMGFAWGTLDAYVSYLFAPFSYPRGGTPRSMASEVGSDDLPLEDYDELTVEEVSERLEDLSAREVSVIRSYEERHKRRGTLLERLDRALV